MLRRKLLAAALALALSPVAALANSETPDAAAPMPILEIDVVGQANGTIRIALRPDLAPGHVARIIDLAESDAYDNVVFHRVIEGFMAQTGDVQFGRRGESTARAGMGGSDLPDLPAEFSTAPFERGVMGMARSQSPNSANSQFFLMFAPAPHLNGQYTVLGEIIDGFDVLDAIRRGRGRNGAMLDEPDYMADVRVLRPEAPSVTQ
jgi:peptidylprolyl isomerase